MAKILIIEDDMLVARLYKKAFELERWEVEVAGGGEEGINKIKLNRPTVVLLDIMMPHVSGFDVLDAVKLDQATKNIPIIILTNLAGEKDAQVALTKGAVKYIVKSAHEPREVVEIVKEIVKGYSRDELPTTPVMAAQTTTIPVSSPTSPSTLTPTTSSTAPSLSSTPTTTPPTPATTTINTNTNTTNTTTNNLSTPTSNIPPTVPETPSGNQ